MSDSFFNQPARCVVCTRRFDQDKRPTFPCPDCNLAVCGWCAGTLACCRIKAETDAALTELQSDFMSILYQPRKPIAIDLLDGSGERKTPFMRGYEVGLTGNGIAPHRFPRPDDSWATRLYFRGWEKGDSERNK